MSINIDEVKGIKEAVANMKEHYSSHWVNSDLYQVFYDPDTNSVDFTVESWGEEWPEWIIPLMESTKPATVKAIKRALKARGGEA